VNLTQLTGTGAGGRITRKDVLIFIENGPTKADVSIPASSPVQQSIPATKETLSSKSEEPASQAALAKARPNQVEITEDGDEIIPVSSVRKTIASRMVQSKHDAPHAWTMVEVDVTSLVKYRNGVKDEFKQKEGLSLTFLPFFIKAVVEALKEYPLMNSTWAGDKIIVKKRINISIAVATEDALYVPVIHDADQNSLLGIAKSIDDLAKRARAGRLSMADMQGGTFTVNNTGSFGSILSAPIINSPQAAIVSMESIVKKPVVIDDMIAVRSMVNLCLSLDHRVLDGLVCGKFLQSVKFKLENYGPETKLY
ncbi:MAG: dihydrolipoamide acetyltransferase family protein, partial [Bacilli bacterium]